MSQTVSFRFLKAITNPITDDSVTVGLLHWDGERLRFAHDSSKVSGISVLARALDSIQEQVNNAKPNYSETNLQKVFEVSEGDGSLLKWAEVRGGMTSNSEQNFLELVIMAGLKDDHPDIQLDNGGSLTWCELCQSYWQCGCE
jgi:hypothetical protein